MSASSPSLNGCSSTSPNSTNSLAANNFSNGYYNQQVNQRHSHLHSLASTSRPALSNGQFYSNGTASINGTNTSNFIPSSMNTNNLINGFDIKVSLLPFGHHIFDIWNSWIGRNAHRQLKNHCIWHLFPLPFKIYVFLSFEFLLVIGPISTRIIHLP